MIYFRLIFKRIEFYPSSRHSGAAISYTSRKTLIQTQIVVPWCGMMDKTWLDLAVLAILSGWLPLYKGIVNTGCRLLPGADISDAVPVPCGEPFSGVRGRISMQPSANIASKFMMTIGLVRRRRTGPIALTTFIGISVHYENKLSSLSSMGRPCSLPSPA